MQTDATRLSQRIARLADVIAAGAHTAAKSPSADDRAAAIVMVNGAVTTMQRLLEQADKAGHTAAVEAELKQRGLLT